MAGAYAYSLPYTVTCTQVIFNCAKYGTRRLRRFAVRVLIELMSRMVNVMSLRHTWQCVVSKLFHITGYSVSFVRNVTEADAVPFCELLIHRNDTFLTNLQKFHSQHLVIGYLVRHSGKNELHELSDIL